MVLCASSLLPCLHFRCASLPSLVTVVLDGVFCDFEIAAVFFQMNNVQNVLLPVASFVVIL